MKSPLNLIMASSMWNGRLVNLFKSKNQQPSCYQLKQFPLTFYLLEKCLVLLCLIELFLLFIVLTRKNAQNEANKSRELK